MSGKCAWAAHPGFLRISGAVEEKTLALWELSFKANTGDLRESPEKVASLLSAQGRLVQVYAPVAMESMEKVIAGNCLV